jgi:Lrp/AsnC family transcriptional regulator, regulator for asnA, asnC and gidA
MDSLNRDIIIELQKNPRISARKLALSLSVNTHTVKKRIENLISSNSIVLTALPDLKRLGYPIRAFFLLEVDQIKIDELEKQLCHLSQIHFISNCVGFNKFWLRGDFATIDSVKDFIKKDLGKIQGINRTETIIELERLKYTYCYDQFADKTYVSLPHSKDYGLSEIDYLLIKELQKNARVPLKELSHTVGMSQMTVHQHIRRLLSSKIIELTAIINISDFGYQNSHARIEVKPDMIEEVAASCVKFPQIITAIITSGPTNLLVIMNGDSKEIIPDFVTRELSKINGIIRIEFFAFYKMVKNNFTWLSD